MTDYHTTYKGPEGQTTQWEDIQIKLGNMAPKPKKAPAPKYEGEQEIIKDAKWVAGKDEDELAEMEDDFTDDRMLESIRQRRLKELQDAANAPQHGRLEFIRSSDFRQAVTEASESTWVVVALYKDNSEGCAVLLDCFSKLAARHPQTKFLKIISTDCIHDLPDANLPTVLVYFEKKCQKTFAGLNVWGGKRASEECATLTPADCHWVTEIFATNASCSRTYGCAAQRSQPVPPVPIELLEPYPSYGPLPPEPAFGSSALNN